MLGRLLPLLLAIVCSPACSSSRLVGDTHTDVDADDPGTDDVGDISHDFLSDDVAFPPSQSMPPVCGDGHVDPGEECDDGNRMNGDECDWLCRNGSGSFEYPPLDPSTPAIEPGGASTPVTLDDELTLSSFGLRAGRPCRGIWLEAGGGHFALAYNRDRPSYGVSLRVLERDGMAAGPAWSRETGWDARQEALTWGGEEFALFSSVPWDGVSRSRFAPDGTVLEELLTVRGPDPCDTDDALPCWDPTDAAWNADRWVLAGMYSINDRPWAVEEYDSTGASVAVSTLRPARDIPPEERPMPVTDCLQVAATPEGFAVSDGMSTAVIGLDLGIVGWSGVLRDFDLAPGVLDIAPDGIWLAWLAQVFESGTWTNEQILWVAAFDLDGSLRFPPRPVHGPFYIPFAPDIVGDGTPFNDLAIAYGPAGAAVVFWEGLGEGIPGGTVKILNMDDWANVRTPPQSVLEDDATTEVGWVLGIDGDDEGYGVVTAVEGSVPGTAVLVFRYFVAAT